MNGAGTGPWSPTIQATPVWTGCADRVDGGGRASGGVGSGQVKLTWSAPASEQRVGASATT